MLAQEAGRWEQAKEFAAQLHISARAKPENYAGKR